MLLYWDQETLKHFFEPLYICSRLLTEFYFDWSVPRVHDCVCIEVLRVGDFQLQERSSVIMSEETIIRLNLLPLWSSCTGFLTNPWLWKLILQITHLRPFFPCTTWMANFIPLLSTPEPFPVLSWTTMFMTKSYWQFTKHSSAGNIT